MNNIEQLHLKVIKSSWKVNLVDPFYNNETEIIFQENESASKSAKITEEIAIEFAEWRDRKLIELNKWELDGVKCGDKLTTKELFDSFIKTKNNI